MATEATDHRNPFWFQISNSNLQISKLLFQMKFWRQLKQLDIENNADSAFIIFALKMKLVYTYFIENEM